MSQLAVLRKRTVSSVAHQLDLHPFEVVRLLTAADALPRDLRLEAAHVERVRVTGGLETWWEVPPPTVAGEPRARTLARLMVGRMIERGVVSPRSTRADNLFRGLDPDAQIVLRRAANVLIKEQLLTSRMAAEGLVVGVAPASLSQLREFAAGGGRLLDALWEQL